MQWLLYVYTRWKCAQFRELRQYAETAKFDPTSMMNGGGLRYHHNAKQAHVALCSPQLWSEDDQYHISTEAHWSLRVPDEQPCTMTTFSSQCATNIYTSHMRKDKNTQICQIRWNKYEYMFWHHNRRWMLHNCLCWNGKLCSRPLYQWSIQSFSFQNSWLQKYISVWEARH